MHRFKSCRWREVRTFDWGVRSLQQNVRQPRLVPVNKTAVIACKYHSSSDGSRVSKPKDSRNGRLTYEWEEQPPAAERPSTPSVRGSYPKDFKKANYKVQPLEEPIKNISNAKQRHRGRKGIMIAKQFSSDFICFREGTAKPAPLTPTDEFIMSTAQHYFGEAYRELYSAARLSEHVKNPAVPEVALIGAVGTRKATFINGLFGVPDNYGVDSLRDEVIKMSMYGVNFPIGWYHDHNKAITDRPRNAFILADTPEYSLVKRPAWGKEVVNYLEKRENLKGAVLLLSLSKTFNEMDKWVLHHLADKKVNTSVILTGAHYFPKRWEPLAAERAQQVRREMIKLDMLLNNGWVKNNGWMPDIHVVAPGIEFQPTIGNGGGLGGARKVILELAGFDLTKPFENDSLVRGYLDHVVSFDALQT